MRNVRLVVVKKSKVDNIRTEVHGDSGPKRFTIGALSIAKKLFAWRNSDRYNAMSRQQGRGGMGSHKHGSSGKTGMPPGLKQQLAREENKRKRKKKRRQTMYDSIRALMKALTRGSGGRKGQS